MPHQCVRCNTFYEDGSDEILKGCNCGGKLFFYIKKDKLDTAKELIVNLSDKEKGQIEEDILDIIGKDSDNEPVILDIESIRVQKPGKYEIDLVTLFKGEPLIYKVGEGKYIIDLIRSFKKVDKEKIGKEKGATAGKRKTPADDDDAPAASTSSKNEKAHQKEKKKAGKDD